MRTKYKLKLFDSVVQYVHVHHLKNRK